MLLRPTDPGSSTAYLTRCLNFEEKQVQDALAVVVPEGIELDVRTKRLVLVRAGEVMREFRGGPGGEKLEKAIVLNSAFQFGLNKIFAASAAVHKYTDMLLFNVTGESCVESRLDAMKRNWEIISGDLGRALMKDILEMLRNFRDGLWSGLQLSPHERFKDETTT